MTPQERLCQLRLARTKGIGTTHFNKLMGLYGTAEHAIEALPVRARLANKPAPPVPSSTQIEDEIAYLSKQGACHLLRSDNTYPHLLSTLPKAPLLLFARGNIALLSTSSVAIVGARKASSPALDLTEQFAKTLAESGQTIVSGLARGIDGAAHRGALPYHRTIAALPGGLDVTYPLEHKALQEEIGLHGCLITEYPPGTAARARHFPQRNHLIAGLARACLLVEAAQRSGTLITARLALTYQRLLFAIPGFPKDPRSNGGNHLLSEGKALLAQTPQDILKALATTALPPRQPAAWSRPQAPSLFQFAATTPAASFPQEDASTPILFSTPSQHVAPVPPSSTQNSSSPKSSPFHVETPSLTSIPPAATPQKSTPQHDTFIKKKPNNDKKNILSLLAHTPCTVDEIALRCQLSIADVAAILIELEICGLITRHADGQITCSK